MVVTYLRWRGLFLADTHQPNNLPRLPHCFPLHLSLHFLTFVRIIYLFNRFTSFWDQQLYVKHFRFSVCFKLFWLTEPLDERASRAFVKSFIPGEKETDKERSSSGLTARDWASSRFISLFFKCRTKCCFPLRPIMLSQLLHK